MHRLLVALVFIGGFSFAQGQGPPKDKFLPIVFDDWWNVDYVKQGCKLSAESVKQGYPGAKPCVTDTTPAEMVKEFEDELIVAFASESTCHGLSLIHFTTEMAEAGVKNPNGPASEAAAKTMGPNWSLMLDLSGSTHIQTGRGWTLVDSERHVLNGHIMSPQHTVQQICKVVKGVGGKLRN
jgi:hypothetical protein